MSLDEADYGTNATDATLFESAGSTRKSIWDAFEGAKPALGRNSAWRALPCEAGDATEASLIATAAMLAALVSSDGTIRIETAFGGKARVFLFDRLEFLSSADPHAAVAGWTEVAPSQTGVADIFVGDAEAVALENAPVELRLDGVRQEIRARSGVVSDVALARLRDLAVFAGVRCHDPAALTPAALLPAQTPAKRGARQSYVARLRNQVKTRPQATAVRDDRHDTSLSYAQMWAASGALAARIRKTAPEAPRVALLLERGWQHLTAVLAIQRLGGTCILIDPDNPDARIAAFIAECLPDVMIAAGSTTERFADQPRIVIEDLETLLEEAATAPDPVAQTCNQTAFVAGTSGSTGKPKAVCLSYAGMAATLDAIIDSAVLTTGTRGSWLSSPGYGMVEVDPIPVLAAGGTVYVPPLDAVQDVRLLADWYGRHGIDHTLVMTSLAEALWATAPDLELRSMLIAGERCKQWPPSGLGYRVLNVYGSAEAAVVSIEDLTAKRRTAMPSVGRAVAGAHMYVTDALGREMPANSVGELVITGETLSVGYIDAEQTAKAFRPNTIDSHSDLQYVTGDRARMRPDGTVEIYGRNDGMVKIRGHRVDLAEIEIATREVPGVAKAAVKHLEADGGGSLILFVEPIERKDDLESRIRAHLTARLAAAAVPARIVTHVLPLGRNGKVDYDRLEVPASADAQQPEFDPSTPVGQLLKAAWITWTQSDRATLDANFFHCGGDSLKAMRMVGELACQHGIVVEMSAFIQDPTLSTLLRLAEASATKELPRFSKQPEAMQSKPFELNQSQQALWIGRGGDFDYGGVGCQGYFEFEVEKLDYHRFLAAVETVVARHPMLRMSISKQGLQQIGDHNGRDAVSYRDLSRLPQAKIDAEIDEIRQRLADEEIGTTTWPLYTFEVSRIRDGMSRIHFAVDMLVADAWSIFQVIIPDLIDAYFGDADKLPTLTTTFCDYVAYRNAVTQTEQYQADRAYWAERIKTLPPAPKLPVLDRGDDAAPGKFQRFESSLDPEVWSRLTAAGKTRNISASGVVGLALCEVLRAWSENDDFTLNFPVSDRLPVAADIDNVVGDFTNTLLVPFEAARDTTLAMRGRHFQNAIWQSLDHRLFTGVEVLRELSRLHRNGREPLMPVVLTSLLGHPGRHDVARLGREVYGVSQTPQVTLDVQLRDSAGALYFKWDYLGGVIRPDVLSDMFAAFCGLLTRLAEDESLWDQQHFDLRPAAQIARREQVNATRASVPKVGLRGLLRDRIVASADATAVTDAQTSLTWGELGGAAAQIAQQVTEAREPWQRHVGVFLPKSALQYAAVYGCVLAGVGYVPIDTDAPDERLRSILLQAETDVVITTPDAVLPKHLRRIDIDHDLLRDWATGSAKAPTVKVPKDYAPYVIFTSGSTGAPKGVEIPERAVLNHAFDVVDRFELGFDTKHLATAALHFDMSVFDVFGPIVHGGSVVLPEVTKGTDPDGFLAAHRAHKTTFWACVPAIMDLLCTVDELAVDEAPIDTLRHIVMAGDFIPLSLLPRARSLFSEARLFSCGGPTETTNWSILHEITPKEGRLVKSVPYGAPMRNSAYHIVGPDWSDRPDWVPGEMVVESDVSLANGYIGRPDLTNKAFETHPRRGVRVYHTGDLGRYLPGGEIEILGRIDNQIKINGLRIELGEVEKVAENCLGVTRACAFTLKGKDGRPKQIALAYTGNAAAASGIAAALAEKLPKYMLPKTIRHFPELPLSGNGKVDVKTLRQEVATNMTDTTPKTSKAFIREVLKTVANHLDQQMVLPDDNFFDLGGDSLNAMKIKIDLESQLGKDVSLEDVMMTETFGDLAAKVALEA